MSPEFYAGFELAHFLRLKKKETFNLCSILFHDPWFDIDDIKRLDPLPSQMLSIDNGVYYLHDLKLIDQQALFSYRAQCESFLKVMYISTMSVQAVFELFKDGHSNQMALYLASIRYVVINACDDETWVLARVAAV